MHSHHRSGIIVALVALVATSCVAKPDAQIERGDYQARLGSHALTYVGKRSGITDFTGLGQHLYYFPLFGLTSPETGKRTDDRDAYYQGIFRGFEHHRLLDLDTRTFSPDAGGSPVGVKSKGGFSSFPIFTLPDGTTGRSGAVYDDHTLDGNSNNTINQVITRHDEPRDFCLNIITDNTAGQNNPDKRLEARLDSGGTEIDVDLAGHPDFTFDGQPDMYTFLYEGMSDDERFKIRLSTSSTSSGRGAGFGGIMVSDVSTCTACTPSCDGKTCGSDGCGGSCGTCNDPDTCEAGVCTPPSPGVTMGSWRGFATGPYSHPRESGSKRMLVFTAHGRDRDNRYVQSVKYGDRPMTRLVTRTHCDGRCLHSSIWYLLESGIAAASGTTFSVNWNSNPTDRGYDSVFFTGVNQGAPFGDWASAAGSGSAVSCRSNVVESGHVLLYSASHKNQDDYRPLGGVIEDGDYAMGSEGKAAVGHLDGTGASVTPGVSMQANPQTIVCAEIQN
jgi:hypothetical protein